MRYTLLLLYLLWIGLACAAEQTPVDRKVRAVAGGDCIKADLSIIGEDREAVIEKLRLIADKTIDHIGTTSMNDSNAKIALLRLGDSVTIEKMIAEYRKYDSREAWQYIPEDFEYARSPMVIPYLAEDFYSEENAAKGIKKSQGEMEFAISAPPRSIYSGVITTRIIEKSREFDPAMKQWAKEMYQLRLSDPAAFRKKMKIWWEQNKQHFADKQYMEVKVLQDIPEAPPVVAAAPEPTPAPTPAPVVKEPEPTPPTPAPVAVVAPLEAPKPTPPVRTWPLWACLSLAVLAASAVAWKFLRK